MGMRNEEISQEKKSRKRSIVFISILKSPPRMTQKKFLIFSDFLDVGVTKGEKGFSIGD